MVTKSFICSNGHRWPHNDHASRCPKCGAEAAETVGNGDPVVGSAGAGQSGSGDTTPEEAKLSKFGRYRLVDELGRGGMGIVYRAFDPVQGHEVALKTLPTTEPALLSRFKREFRVLADVDHPNVVKLFELTSDGETWFFTMEIIDGVDLLTYIQHGFSPPPTEASIQAAGEGDPTVTEVLVRFELTDEKKQRLRDAFAQLAEAIASLHASGIVHRDLKPSNVVVTKEGRVVLLDFGLVAETDPSGSHRSVHQQVMGTAAYMSPEQAACETVTAASDWYSVGVMLYQAMTGELPFAGKTLDILVRKQQQDPLPPSKLSPAVPEDWNNLCMNLLQRSPDKRRGAEEIWRVLGGQSNRITMAASPEPDEVILVGREKEFQSLQDTWQQVRRGQAKSIFVEGGSGTGKSALVEAFLQQASSDSPVVLKGRCYEMESVPFKAIDSLVDSLVSHLRHLSKADAAALMPREIHALSSLFPVITQVEAVASLPHRQVNASDQQELNRRAIGALRELLARMGDRYPLIVYIDDLQWGDEDSAAMLSDLLQPPDPPLLLFFGTYRNENAETSQFLQSFRQIQRQRESPLNSLQIQLEPLQHADAIALGLALLGRNDAEAQQSAKSIAGEAAGNPFFVSELVKHLQLEGARVSKPDASSGLAHMIWSRVQGLPEESQRLLAIVALWGQPLPLEHAMHVADVGQGAVGPLRTGHLIRTVGLTSSSKIETYHDRIRESVSECLDHATKQQFHLRIAENCVHGSPLDADEIMQRLAEYFAEPSASIDDHLEIVPMWYEIAFHFDAAGRSDMAFPYALAAAEKSRAQFSLEVAEQQYRIAEHDVNSRAEALACRLAEGLGNVLMLRGKYGEAAEQFEAARKIVTEPNARARMEGKLGELAFKRGDNKAGIEAMERSLRLLGRTVPSNTAGFLPRLAWEVTVQSLHTMFPKLFLNRRSPEGAEQELLEVNLHVHLSRAYFFERGKVPCLWAHLRSINLAEPYSPTRHLGEAWAAHAPIMSIVPWLRRGEVYGKKSLEIRKRLGDVWGQGQSLHYLGVVYFAGARLNDCISSCREAVRLLEQTGDYWEVNVARFSIANSLYRKGDLEAAISEAKKLYDAANEMGDDKALTIALDVWSRASGGRLPADIVRRELQKQRNDLWATTQVFLAEAVRRVGQNELDEAARILTRAHEECRKLGMNAWVSPILPWLATTLRLQCGRLSGSTRQRRQLLSNTNRAARRALAVARKFHTDLPHALRECGLIGAMQGSDRRAQKYLDKSLRVAGQQGARLEHAQTMLARGLIGQKFHWSGAEKEVAEARETLIVMGADFALALLESAEPV